MDSSEGRRDVPVLGDRAVMEQVPDQPLASSARRWRGRGWRMPVRTLPQAVQARSVPPC